MTADAINDSEWELLAVLWQHGDGTAREVTTALEASKGWAYSTVKTMLDRMVDKGLVEAERLGNVWRYRAVVEQEAAQRSAWGRFVDTVFRGTVDPALALLAGDKRLSKSQRAKLKALLEEEEGED